MEYTRKAISILEASRKLFALKGFKAVTTREIAKEAGANEVTIFRHFKNKDILFERMVTYFISRPQVSDYMNENEIKLVKYLSGVGDLIHTIFVENLDLFKIELGERQKVKSMALINSFPNEIKERMRKYLVVKHGYSEDEASTLAVCYMASVHGLCMNLYFLKTFNPRPDFSKCLNFLINRYS